MTGCWQESLKESVQAAIEWTESIEDCYDSYAFDVELENDVMMFRETVIAEYQKIIRSQDVFAANTLFRFIKHESACMNRRVMEGFDRPKAG